MQPIRKIGACGGWMAVALTAWLMNATPVNAQKINPQAKKGATKHPPAKKDAAKAIVNPKGPKAPALIPAPSLNGLGRYSYATPGAGIITLYGNDPYKGYVSPQTGRYANPYLNLYAQPQPYGYPYASAFPGAYAFPGQVPNYALYSPYQTLPYSPYNGFVYPGNPYVPVSPAFLTPDPFNTLGGFPANGVNYAEFPGFSLGVGFGGLTSPFVPGLGYRPFGY